MHELSYVLAAVRRAEEITRSEGVRPVSVTLALGEASGLLPGAVRACWREAVKGTLLAGAALRLETAAALARCLDCGADFRPEFPALSCPRCGGGRFALQTGDDLVIQEIAAAPQ